MSISTTISSGRDEIQLGRFSTGMERITAMPSTLRADQRPGADSPTQRPRTRSDPCRCGPPG